MECKHCKSTSQDPDFLFETNYWWVFLTDEQEYLGRCVIELKQHKAHLSDLSKEEWIDFGELVVKKLETSIEKVFGAELFNWTCLVNNAYQTTPPNPHLHWHLRPRYRKSVKVSGQEFTDPDFGYHYDRERRAKVSKEVFEEILNKIKNSL